MSKSFFQDQNYVQKFIYGNLPCDIETMGLYRAGQHHETDEQQVILNESCWSIKSSGQKDNSRGKSSRVSTRARSQRVSRRQFQQEAEPQFYFTITPRLRALRSNIKNAKSIYMDLEDQVDNSMVDHSKDFNRSNLETIDL